jgi:hypothetical protein
LCFIVDDKWGIVRIEHIQYATREDRIRVNNQKFFSSVEEQWLELGKAPPESLLSRINDTDIPTLFNLSRVELTRARVLDQSDGNIVIPVPNARHANASQG